MTRAYNTATTQQNSGGAVAGVTAGKNVLINGAFEIWQRGTSFASGFSSPYFIADRWQATRAGNVLGATMSRQTSGAPTGFQYYVRLQRDSGNTNTNGINMAQCIETSVAIPYAGQTVTFSFYARAGATYTSAANNVNVYIYTGTGTDQNNFSSSYTGLATALNSTASVTTSWQRFSYTVTLASTVTEFEPLIVTQHPGTAGATDYIDVTGVQVELGSVATPFARAGGTIAGELDTCQRYFQRYGTGAASLYVFGNLTRFTDGAYYGSTAAEMGIIYPVQFRTSPTLSTTGTWKGWTGINHNSTGTLSIQAGTNSNAMLRVEKSSGSWTTDYGYIASEDGGYVNFSAEL